MLPRATKIQMIHLLREKGYKVSSVQGAQFRKNRNAFWLNYQDENGNWHEAYYSAAAGKPRFSIDGNFIKISFDDVARHQMFRLKNRTDS